MASCQVVIEFSRGAQHRNTHPRELHAMLLPRCSASGCAQAWAEAVEAAVTGVENGGRWCPFRARGLKDWSFESDRDSVVVGQGTLSGRSVGGHASGRAFVLPSTSH